MPPNTYKVPTQMNVEYGTEMVTRIRLRGSRISKQHQELMITLRDKTLIRISRNGVTDTFQIGAVEKYINPMPTIFEIPAVGNGITGADVLTAFLKEHRLHPNHEQADCQTFAQNIFLTLYPKAKEDPFFATVDELGW